MGYGGSVSLPICRLLYDLRDLVIRTSSRSKCVLCTWQVWRTSLILLAVAGQSAAAGETLHCLRNLINRRLPQLTVERLDAMSMGGGDGEMLRASGGGGDPTYLPMYVWKHLPRRIWSSRCITWQHRPCSAVQ
jgi:hypothetical protein